jgi:hypothetical protein
MRATTRAALLRGAVTTDALGDEVVDNGAASRVEGWTDFPASIIERDRDEFDQSSSAWRTIREKIIRLPSNIPIRAGDRILDLRDGTVYPTNDFRRTPRGLSGRSSVTLRSVQVNRP